MVSTKTVEVGTFLSDEDFWQKLIEFSRDYCSHVTPKKLLLAILSQADNTIISNEASGFIKQNLATIRSAAENIDYDNLRQGIFFLDIIARALPNCFFDLIIQEIMAKRERSAAALRLAEDLSHATGRDLVLSPGIEPGSSA